MVHTKKPKFKLLEDTPDLKNKKIRFHERILNINPEIRILSEIFMNNLL